MIYFLSLVTSVKDYIEILNKIVESDSQIFTTYFDFGAILTYFVICLQHFFTPLMDGQIWSLPIFIPDIASAVLSEVSVLDTHLFNPSNLLDTNILPTPSWVPNSTSHENWMGDIIIRDAATAVSIQPNLFVYSIEKFIIGFINSGFIWLPTSLSHFIVFRRFLIQGLKPGFVAGLGTLYANIFWIACIIFGWRFFVIPWLSLDFFRYILGFYLVIKYIWDSYYQQNNRRSLLFYPKIFIYSFLITLTEQTIFCPYLKNLSISAESSILETFPVHSFFEFMCVHGAYLLGITCGSFYLLRFVYWFWEKPAYQIYRQFLNSLIVSRLNREVKEFIYSLTSYKSVNTFCLYITMIFAMASIPYFGLDYRLSSPLGFVHEDRLFGIQNRNITKENTVVRETSFLYTQPSDWNQLVQKNLASGRQRWAKKAKRYMPYDTALYDQGIYNVLSFEDVNYGFDRVWLHRKNKRRRRRFTFLRNAFRAKRKRRTYQLREVRKSPERRFFYRLRSMHYDPYFHDPITEQSLFSKFKWPNTNKGISEKNLLLKKLPQDYLIQKGLPLDENSKIMSRYRKFTRKFSTRIKKVQLNNNTFTDVKKFNYVLSNLTQKDRQFFLLKLPLKKNTLASRTGMSSRINSYDVEGALVVGASIGKYPVLEKSKLRFGAVGQEHRALASTQLLYPMKYYSETQKAFQRKLNYYGVNIYRKFSLDKNAPFFRVFMRRLFDHSKPTIRKERTLRFAKINSIRRKPYRSPKKRVLRKATLGNNTFFENRLVSFFQRFLPPKSESLPVRDKQNSGKNTTPPIGGGVASRPPLLDKTIQTKPTTSYSVLGKRAARYRSQIYKDVFEHSYYSPLNRFLLKEDIDSFISRQPRAHFLTKKEEKLLHLRRILLSEHYDSLRWYSLMQQAQTMIDRIGSTKSFASRVYNQQFAGTLKKIRHLFAITPSFSEENILKYDQPLFNEYSSQRNSSLNPYYHEELPAMQEINSLKKPLSEIHPSGDTPAATLFPYGENTFIPEHSSDFSKKRNKRSVGVPLYHHGKELSRPVENLPTEKKLSEQIVQSLSQFSPLSDIYSRQALLEKPQSFTDQQFIKYKQLKKYVYNKRLKYRMNKRVARLRKKNQSHQRRAKLLTKRIREYSFGFHTKNETKKTEQKKPIRRFLRDIKSRILNLFNSKTYSQRVKTENYWKKKILLKTRKAKARRKWKSKKRKARKAQDDTKVLTVPRKQLLEKPTTAALGNTNMTKAFTEKNYTQGNSSVASQDQGGDGALSNQPDKRSVKTRQNWLGSVSPAAVLPGSLTSVVSRASSDEASRSVALPSENEQQRKHRLMVDLLYKRMESDSRSRTTIEGRNALNEINALAQSTPGLQNSSVLRGTASVLNSYGPVIPEGVLAPEQLVELLQSWSTSGLPPLSGGGSLRGHLPSEQPDSDYALLRGPQKRDELEIEYRLKNNQANKATRNIKIDPRHKKGRLSLYHQLTYRHVTLNKRKLKILKKGRLQIARGSKEAKQPLSLALGYKDIFLRYGLSESSSRSISPQIRLFGRKIKGIPLRITRIYEKWTGIAPVKKQKQKRYHKKRKWLRINSKKRSNRKYKKSVIKRKLILKLRKINEKLQRNRTRNQLKTRWQKNGLSPSLRDDLFVEKGINGLGSLAFANQNEVLGTAKQAQYPDKPVQEIQLENIEYQKDAFKDHFGSLYTWFEKTGPGTAPFYAGWDENARQLVISNRFLSRQENSLMKYKSVPRQFTISNSREISMDPTYTRSPVKHVVTAGAEINEHYFLEGFNMHKMRYWSVPFLPANQELSTLQGNFAYSPIQWSRFKFRHTLLQSWKRMQSKLKALSIEKTKVYGFPFSLRLNDLRSDPHEKSAALEQSYDFSKLVEDMPQSGTDHHSPEHSSDFSTKRTVDLEKQQPIILGTCLRMKGVDSNDSERTKCSKYNKTWQQIISNASKQKAIKLAKIRYKQIRETHQSGIRKGVVEVLRPSGKLLHEILPIYYIRIFADKSRTDESRFIQARMVTFKNKADEGGMTRQIIGQQKEFTLRRRLKTQRQYTRTKKNKVGKSFTRLRARYRRDPFDYTAREFADDWMPFLGIKRERDPTLIPRDELIIPREPRVVVEQRLSFKPYSGGIVWPGDYLRLENKSMPNYHAKAKQKFSRTEKTNLRKTSSTKTISEWIKYKPEAKRYLLERHNLKVLIKKLEKTQRIVASGA